MLALLLAANSTGDIQTHLCIEAACAVRSSEGWYILALYMTVGAFVFCSALCCGAWADCDEANSSDLIVISGLGKDVLRRVPLHAIRLEDFVYLLPSLRKSSTAPETGAPGKRPSFQEWLKLREEINGKSSLNPSLSNLKAQSAK
ncbi:hypothetical protein TYRP_000323 [Tyrophagus putrescentiae]|nr:hypothetical protein TYRP_000323 [Tyrophagus putrescentiae]